MTYNPAVGEDWMWIMMLRIQLEIRITQSRGYITT